MPPVLSLSEQNAGSSSGWALPDWTQVLKPHFLESAIPVWSTGRLCLREPRNACPEAVEWEQHWRRLEHGITGRAFSFYRQQIRSRCVARTLARLLPNAGIFVECGCGTSETSCRVRPKPDQTFLAVDFAWRPLRQALQQPCITGGVQADIRDLPFQDSSLDGIWNLGVMEHFEASEQRLILGEFHRVLKPGAPLILWWPPQLAPDRALLTLLGWSFPDEPGRIARAAGRHVMLDAGFHSVSVTRPPSDCFTELVVYGTSNPS
ncbi:methyltransferase domain-containing protein [bacterium]|nr:methyltransferase domain-containing protein [bacterium]